MEGNRQSNAEFCGQLKCQRTLSEDTFERQRTFSEDAPKSYSSTVCTLNYDAPPDLEELTDPDEHEIPIGVRLDHNDLQCMIEKVSELSGSLEQKRNMMNAFFQLLAQSAKAMQGVLNGIHYSTTRNTAKHVNKYMKRRHWEALPGASDVQLMDPPKEMVEEENAVITKDHVEVPYHSEQHSPVRRFTSPFRILDSASPQMDVGQLQQEMRNHMSMHRKMLSRQRDQLQIDRVIPMQQMDAESAASTSTTAPLFSSLLQDLVTDFTVPTNSTQLNGVLPILDMLPSNCNQKKGDGDAVLDWNIDADEEIKDDLFDFLA